MKISVVVPSDIKAANMIDTEELILMNEKGRQWAGDSRMFFLVASQCAKTRPSEETLRTYWNNRLRTYVHYIALLRIKKQGLLDAHI